MTHTTLQRGRFAVLLTAHSTITIIDGSCRTLADAYYTIVEHADGSQRGRSEYSIGVVTHRLDCYGTERLTIENITPYNNGTATLFTYEGDDTL